MSMLQIVQFENGRYGLQNTRTGGLVDKKWRTFWGAYFARRRNFKRLTKTINRSNRR